MFPLFYVQFGTKKTSFYQQPGYVPVLKKGSTFVVQLSEEDVRLCEDDTWVTTTFRNMMFLDQCYWS
jgi:hypothetical protein